MRRHGGQKGSGERETPGCRLVCYEAKPGVGAYLNGLSFFPEPLDVHSSSNALTSLFG